MLYSESHLNHLVDLLEENLLLEFVSYKEGHKNSKGEEAPWVIISHKDGHIISSHKTEKEAKNHLRQIEYFKHRG